LSRDSVVHLLLVGDSLDEAEHLTSTLRAAGYAARTKRVEDAEELADALARNGFDLAVHMLTAEDIDLDTTIRTVREHSDTLPVIAAGDDETSTAEAMRAGATDHVPFADQEHLRHALVREFSNARMRSRARFLEDVYRESEQRARALMESSRDAIAYIHGGMHVLANDAYLGRFGYKAFEELEGTPMMDMVIEEDQAKLKEFLRDYSATEEAVGSIELRLRQADGNSFQAEMEFSRASIEGEACSQIIIRDQGNTEELEKQLNLLSQRDTVTGLYNRQYFMRVLDEALARAENEDAQSAILEIQIDDFAGVRQQVGVLGADKVISSIADVLAGQTGEDDALARLDGATYAVLTSEARARALEQYATRMREQVKDHICEVEDTSISACISIGIACIDGSTRDPNDILSRAERALGEAQKQGPDHQAIYQPKPGELSQKQIDQQWVERIRDILKNNRLRLLYQPIVSLASDAVPRFEIRAEILDDSDNAVEPGELFAAAERTGMSKGLDRWVVLTALKKLAENRSQAGDDTRFFIPLSGHAFDDSGLFRWIHERIKSVDVQPGAVVFEVDAAAAATRLRQAAALATALHKVGCGLALTGFGHGNDPFQLTRHIEADYLRLSEDFTDNLADNPQNQEALRNIASVAREQNIQTICPGVSDAGSLTVIWSVGSDLIQGNFLQEPNPRPDYDFSVMTV